jgi:SAM-dependent methyltransferase
MNDSKRDVIMDAQKQLWREKLLKCGMSPQAVGSESLEHKELRYRLISRIFEGDADFSLLDVGAGVGDFYGYLSAEHSDQHIRYRGVDIMLEFCELARYRYPGIEIGDEDILTDDMGQFDYVALSGLFHQRGAVGATEWNDFMIRTLERAFAMARKGIAFNVLSTFAEFHREGNFYVDVLDLQKLIAQRLSRFYRVCHDGPLFEATIFIFKPEAVLARFPQPEFRRYIDKQEGV